MLELFSYTSPRYAKAVDGINQGIGFIQDYTSGPKSYHGIGISSELLHVSQTLKDGGEYENTCIHPLPSHFPQIDDGSDSASGSGSGSGFRFSIAFRIAE